MGITRLSIDRPLAMLMFILGVVIMGVVAYTMLRIDRLPNIEVGFVSVQIPYPGASPADVEALVVTPIERGLAGVNGIQSMSSNSNEGSGNVSLQLVEGYNVDRAGIDVERRVSQLRSRLPTDIGAITVSKFDPNAQPIMNIALSGQLPQDALFQIGSELVQPRLQSIPGVADVSIFGGLEPEIQVRVDYAKLEAYGLAITTINTALQRENLSAPGGSLEQGRRSVNVRTVGAFQSAQELNNLVIANLAGGPVRLRDVARVEETFKQQTRLLRYNGIDAVGLSITKQSDSNAVEVSDNIKREVERIRQSLPPGLEVYITNDSARFTRASLDAVLRDLMLAVMLTGAVLLLFLHTWRNTVIVLLAIPTSLISTFLMMFAFGFSLNLMTLLALALVIGVLVDGAIVILENINRHIHLGEAPRRAAVTGVTEIGLAVVTITLVDVVVYVPIAFMSGNIGQLFRQYGWTVAAATLASLFVCLTLTPMLASRWLKARDGESGRLGLWSRFTATWERGFDRVALGYSKLLGGALHVRPLVVAIGVAAVASSIVMLQTRFVGSEYVPQEDDGNFSVSVQMPPGSQLSATDAAVRQVEAFLATIPEVQSTYTSVGAGGGGFGGGRRNGNVAVQLIPKRERSRSTFDIMNDVRRFATSVPEATIRPNVFNPLGGGPSGLIVRVLGSDFEEIKRIVNRVDESARAVPGIADVLKPTVQGEPELRAVVDRARAAEIGVTAQQISQVLRTSIGGTVAGQLRPEGQTQKDITVIAEQTDRLDLNKLANIPVASQAGFTGGGAQQLVRLGQVARIERAESPVSISRQDRQRSLTIQMSVVDRSLGEVAQDLRASLREISLPTGYQIIVAGQAQNLEVAQGLLLGAGTLSVILIYMLMVALYESWLYPLAIMFALPVSLIGVLIALKLTDNRINIYSMIGVIMLMGIVAKNAILLVDYTNTLRGRGLPRNEAIREAGKTRLRPIVMTTCTILAAMIPLALKFEEGAESRAPLAMAVIGGVSSSALLSLVLVPVMYTYLDDLQILVGKLFRRVEPARVERVAASPVIAGGSDGDD